MAHELTCPISIAPSFDSCRLVCINDPNAVCGDPGDQCGNVSSSTTPTIPTDGTTPTSDPNQTTGSVPPAPSKKIILIFLI